eukprot:scpid96882/ scgid34924/ 
MTNSKQSYGTVLVCSASSTTAVRAAGTPSRSRSAARKTCSICKPRRLPNELFETLHHIPDPIPDESGEHYRPFEEVYGQRTTEQHRPSLANGKQQHGIPFTPSAQTAKNVMRTVACSECDRPRVLYSERKLKAQDVIALDAKLADMLFSCGASIQDLAGDTSADANVASRVYVRGNLTCTQALEMPSYSAGCFPVVCIQCGGSDNVLHGD